MENNLKESVHFEFYGLPGCGKSTLSHIIAEEFRKNGFDVAEPTYDSAHNTNRFLRAFSKLLVSIIFFARFTSHFYILKKIVRDNQYNDFFSLFYQMINIIPKIFIYNDKRIRLYIWDEGLVQSSISLALINDCNAQDNFRQLLDLTKKPKVIKVYLITDIDTAIYRMNKRTSNLSRVEKEDDPVRKRVLLTRFEECCQKILNEDCLLFYSDIQQNELIYKELLKLLENYNSL